MGEAPETTVQNLGAYIKYIHVKDSVMTENGVEYRMMGEGDLPVDEMVFALRSINYDGYISLEWVKRWAPDLSDAGIVFPHFINYMERYLHKQVSRRPLFDLSLIHISCKVTWFSKWCSETSRSKIRMMSREPFKLSLIHISPGEIRQLRRTRRRSDQIYGHKYCRCSGCRRPQSSGSDFLS